MNYWHPIVLSGPPGSGKSHTAHAIANLFNCSTMYCNAQSFIYLTHVPTQGTLVIIEAQGLNDILAAIQSMEGENVRLLFTTQHNLKPNKAYSLIKCTYRG